MKHAFNAFWYSMAGLKVLFGEKAARLEIMFFVFACLLLLVIGASMEQWLITIVLFLAMFGMEAMNTAIEVLVDHLSPEKSQFAKEAKDLGSAAVFCLIAATSLYLLYLLAGFVGVTS